MTDYSPGAADERANQARTWLVELNSLPMMSDGRPYRSCGTAVNVAPGSTTTGEHLRDINVVWSLVQNTT